MKRLCVFVIALFCTLTASAAGSAINRVTLDGAAVTVNVTAETDCALTVALYDADGRPLDIQTRQVGATAGRDVSVTIPGGIPAGSVAKAFLTGADNKPVCKATTSSDSGNSGGGDTPATDDVHAILYADGTMVFQHGDTPENGKTVTASYPVDMGGYSYNWNFQSTTPWEEQRESILKVRFADKIQPKSTAFWFCWCTNLTEIIGIENLDTANVTSMQGMFYDCWSLTALDLSGFDTANVTDMSYMFGGDGGGINGCRSLTTLDLSGFNTSNVTNMKGMFSSCRSLTTLDLSGFNTSNVTNMSFMFDTCVSLTALDLNGFNTANVTDMTYMFAFCSSLTTLDLSGFNTVNVTDMNGMFQGCRALTALNLSNFNTANVTDMGEMFYSCSSLSALDLTSFNTSNITNMRYMFYDCRALTTLDLSGFNTANVTDVGSMFSGCNKLKTIYASGKFVTASVPEIDYYNNSTNMFLGCTSLLGGAGTIYDSEHTDKEYARIDGGASAPGYFTAK